METDWSGGGGINGNSGHPFTGGKEIQSVGGKVRAEHRFFCTDCGEFS